MTKKIKPNLTHHIIIWMFVSLFFIYHGSLIHAVESKTYKVKTGGFYQTTVLTGNITAREYESLIVPLTDNYRIQIKWMAKEGDSVKPGDPVVRFDDSGVLSTIENMELSLRDKEEAIKQKNADYANQELELNLKVKQAEIAFRQKEIDASVPKEILSAQQYEQNQVELKKKDEGLKNVKIEREVTLEGLKLELQRMKLEMEEIKRTLDKTQKTVSELTLNAKTSGSVMYSSHDWTGRKLQVGDNVFANNTVVTIPNNSSLQVEAWLDETLVHRIKKGQVVEIFPDAYLAKRFTGKVMDIMKTADKVQNRGKTRYFNVVMKLDSLDLSIMKPGMSVKCVVHSSSIPSTLTIPLEFAYFDGQSFWVKPKNQNAVKIKYTGFNEFLLALEPGANAAITEGTVLEPVDASKIKE